MSGFNPQNTTATQDWLLRKFFYKSNGGVTGAPTEWVPKKRYTDGSSKFRTDGQGNVFYSDEFDGLFSGGQAYQIVEPLDFVMVKRRRGLLVKFLMLQPGVGTLAEANRRIKSGNIPNVDQFPRWYNVLINDRQFRAKMQILACKELNASAMKRAANKFARENACSTQYREQSDAIDEVYPQIMGSAFASNNTRNIANLSYARAYRTGAQPTQLYAIEEAKRAVKKRNQ